MLNRKVFEIENSKMSVKRNSLYESVCVFGVIEVDWM